MAQLDYKDDSVFYQLVSRARLQGIPRSILFLTLIVFIIAFILFAYTFITSFKTVEVINGEELGVNNIEEVQIAEEQPEKSAETDSPLIEEEHNIPLDIVVHVSGNVHHPGIYEIKSDKRVADAIELAGGPLDDADENRLNLAMPLQDGMKIEVPHKNEEALEHELISSLEKEVVKDNSSTSKININTATLEELQTLNGVGEKTAQSIIDERERNGKFTSVEDLIRVSGIGDKKLEQLKDHITV